MLTSGCVAAWVCQHPKRPPDLGFLSSRARNRVPRAGICSRYCDRPRLCAVAPVGVTASFRQCLQQYRNFRRSRRDSGMPPARGEMPGARRLRDGSVPGSRPIRAGGGPSIPASPEAKRRSAASRVARDHPWYAPGLGGSSGLLGHPGKAPSTRNDQTLPGTAGGHEAGGERCRSDRYQAFRPSPRFPARRRNVGFEIRVQVVRRAVRCRAGPAGLWSRRRKPIRAPSLHFQAGAKP